MSAEEILRRFVDLAKEAVRLQARKETKETVFVRQESSLVTNKLLERLGYRLSVKGDTAEGEIMKPPIFQDGSFRQLKYCLEYRFMFNGHQESVYGQTKEICYQKRLDLLTGKTKSKKCLTFEKWLKEWAAKYKKPNVTPESYEAITRYISQISDKLGSTALLRVNTGQLQDFLNNEKRSNTRTKLASILSDSLRKAYDTQLIKHNPYLAVEYKKEKSKSYPVLQPDEQLTVYEAITDKKYKDLYRISVCTGMRISELIGLKVKDIDFKNRIITVKQQLDRNNNPKEKLKTDASYRYIDFLPELFDGVDLSKDYLFELSYTAVRSYFRRLFDKLKLEFVLHSFRHTFISNCYFVGIRDKQIQLWAGHSKVEVTLNTYTHILKGFSPFIEYVKKLSSTLK